MTSSGEPITIPCTIHDPRLKTPVYVVGRTELPFLQLEPKTYAVAMFLSSDGEIHYEWNNPLARVGLHNSRWFNLFFRRKHYYLQLPEALVAGSVLGDRLTMMGGAQLIVDIGNGTGYIVALGILPRNDRHDDRAQALEFISAGIDHLAAALGLRSIAADTSNIPAAKMERYGYKIEKVVGLWPRVKRFIIIFPGLRKQRHVKSYLSQPA